MALTNSSGTIVVNGTVAGTGTSGGKYVVFPATAYGSGTSPYGTYGVSASTTKPASRRQLLAHARRAIKTVRPDLG